MWSIRITQTSSGKSTMSLPMFVATSLWVFLGLISSRSIGNSLELSVREGCQELLESFAEVTANFTRCTIQNARPITVCQACVDSYINVCTSYQEILKLHDEGGTPCKLQLINVDRLEVVQASYSFVVNQWNRASCNDCFQNKSGSISPAKNDFTVEILKNYDYLASCISNNRNGSDTNSTVNPQICNNCSSYYHDLNEYYDVNKAKVNGFCMDIVDMMNSTRSDWSQKYGCCAEREKPEIIFLITAFSFCFIPLVFYLLVRLCTTRHLLSISTPKRWQQYLSSGSSTTNLVQS